MILHIIFDVLGVTGLAMLAYGLYMISPAAMYLVIGALFVLFALAAERGSISIKNPFKKPKVG